MGRANPIPADSLRPDPGFAPYADLPSESGVRRGAMRAAMTRALANRAMDNRVFLDTTRRDTVWGIAESPAMRNRTMRRIETEVESI